MGEKPRRRSDSIVDASQNAHRRRGCGEFDRAFDADLAFELRPAKAEGGARMGGEIAAFGIGGVGIKNTNLWVSVCFNSTMLMAGRPVASAWVRAMAAGSAGSYLCMWANQV